MLDDLWVFAVVIGYGDQAVLFFCADGFNVAKPFSTGLGGGRQNNGNVLLERVVKMVGVDLRLTGCRVSGQNSGFYALCDGFSNRCHAHSGFFGKSPLAGE